MIQSPGQTVCLNPWEEPWPRKAESTCDISWKDRKEVPCLSLNNFFILILINILRYSRIELMHKIIWI